MDNRFSILVKKTRLEAPSWFDLSRAYQLYFVFVIFVVVVVNRSISVHKQCMKNFSFFSYCNYIIFNMKKDE